MSKLFRTEVIAHRTERLGGDISLAVPIGWQAVGYLFLATLIVSAVFLFSANYPRIETVSGMILPDKGVTAVVPSRPGVITQLLVQEGQDVRVGTALAMLSSAELLEDGTSASGEMEKSLAAQHEGERLSRVAFHGEKIAKWVAPLFEDDALEVVRLRHTICLLAGSSWNSHPEYRADHAAKLALEGHWPGVTAADRAIMATGLYAAFGGRRETPAFLEMLAPKELLDRANQWGLAVRLAQRLDGGTGVALDTVTLQSKNGEPSLEYGEGSKHLDVSTVRRRLKHLREAISKSQLNAAVPA